MQGEEHLRRFLQPAPESDDEFGLPAQSSGDYKPHAAPANKPVFAVHFIKPSGDVRSFQYADLDSDSRYTADAIRLRFSGTRVIEVTIRGRNLWRLYDGIHRQVIRWAMEAARDFAKDGECIVRSIEIAEVRQSPATPAATDVANKAARAPAMVD